MKKTRGRPALNPENVDNLEVASAVSMHGNRFYRMALRELAARRKTSIAALVRKAVDDAYGQELAPLASFFEQSGLFEVR